MKKIYQKPAMQAVTIRQKCNILGTSLGSVGGNAGFNPKVSAGSGTARSRSFDDWDDEE